jgi:hypothetical protein
MVLSLAEGQLYLSFSPFMEWNSSYTINLFLKYQDKIWIIYPVSSDVSETSYITSEQEHTLPMYT